MIKQWKWFFEINGSAVAPHTPFKCPYVVLTTAGHPFELSDLGWAVRDAENRTIAWFRCSERHANEEDRQLAVDMCVARYGGGG